MLIVAIEQLGPPGEAVPIYLPTLRFLPTRPYPFSGNRIWAVTLTRKWSNSRHLNHEKEVEAIFGLPPGVHSYAILPIGYPLGNFGPVGRGSLADVVYQDRWGQTYAALD